MLNSSWKSPQFNLLTNDNWQTITVSAKKDRLANMCLLEITCNHNTVLIKKFNSIQSSVDISVPFRDSKLTMLLKNALCGNSKTIMVRITSVLEKIPS